VDFVIHENNIQVKTMTDGKPTVQMGPTVEQIKEASKRASQKNRPITTTINPMQAPQGAPLMQGVGSGFAANQEVSTGQRLSEKTIEGLEQLQAQNAAAVATNEQKEAAKVEAEEARAKEDVKEMAGLGAIEATPGLIDAVANNPYLDEEVRKQIEASLEPMDMTKLIMGRGVQEVRLNDALVVVFQTISVKEDLVIKQIMRKHVDETVAFYEDTKLALNLSVGVAQVNQTALPSLENDSGQVTAETILARYSALAVMPVQLLAWLAINYIWFDLRVRKMLLPSKLKNG
jgi:hypothetical protein